MMRGGLAVICCWLLLAGQVFAAGSFAPFQASGYVAPSGSAPIVTNATFNPSTPASSGGAVGTVSATNTPTSWSITAGNSAGDFAISNSGVITFTATGQTDWAGAVNLKTATLTVQATNASGSGSGIVDVNGYADGSVGAPSASIQLPTLLSGYAVRPPWKVAGVDYAVGYSTGTTLNDPASASITGCVYSSGAHTFTCSTAGVTVSNLDFSLHSGISLACRAANLLIENNNFGNSGGNISPIVDESGCSNPTIINNVIDGGGSAGDASNFDALVWLSRTSDSGATIEYNWFKNAPADMIDEGIGTGIVQWNLFQNAGQTSGSHPDTTQAGGPGNATYIVNFNTIVNTSIAVASQGITFVGDGATFVGTNSIQYNTEIAGGASLSFSYINIPNPATLSGTLALSNNYGDIRQAYGFIYPGNCSGGVTCSNNTNMVTGAAFSNSP